MKYYILINQLVLSKTELDITDGAILDYIYFYCNSQNEKVKKGRITDEGGEIWTWVDYQSLLKDMPMLKIKDSGALARRIEKIESAGYIKTKRFQHMKKYFRMTAKSDGLLININRAVDIEQQGQTPVKTNPVVLKQPIKSNKDKRDKSGAKAPIHILIDFFYKEVKEVRGFTPEISKREIGLLKTRLGNYTPDQIKGLIKWYLESKDCDRLGASLSTCLSSAVINKYKEENSIK